jgi:hypothetical protein
MKFCLNRKSPATRASRWFKIPHAVIAPEFCVDYVAFGQRMQFLELIADL